MMKFIHKSFKFSHMHNDGSHNKLRIYNLCFKENKIKRDSVGTQEFNLFIKCIFLLISEQLNA